MNLLEACEYIFANPKSVLTRKGSIEPRTILHKRGSHICISSYHPSLHKYRGGIPVYLDSYEIQGKWEDTGKTLDELIEDSPNMRLRDRERAEEKRKNGIWEYPPL